MSKPLIWVLLGMPFEAKQMDYNALQSLSVWLPPTAVTLSGAAKAGLTPPWPDLVIAIGRRSVPVARWIKAKSGGKTKLVRIGHPRIDPSLFDLVVTTRQYPVPPGGNVVLLPVAMSRFVAAAEPTVDERAFLDEAGRFRLVAVGGATKYWTLPVDRIVEAVERPFEGKVVVVTSRRTDPAIIERLRAMLGIRLVDGASPRFAVLLAAAEEIFVTGDSVSMLSEAVLAGKPVALIPIEQDDKGKRALGEEVQENGPNARRRDLRRFWNYLIEQEMVGTVDEGPKRAVSIPNPNQIAADAVRRLLS